MPWYSFKNITLADEQYLWNKLESFADHMVNKLQQLIAEAPPIERSAFQEYLISFRNLKTDPNIETALSRFGYIATLTAFAYGTSLKKEREKPEFKMMSIALEQVLKEIRTFNRELDNDPILQKYVIPEGTLLSPIEELKRKIKGES